MNNILNFPPEILSAVFSWIPVSQRMRVLTPVCSLFRSVVHSNVRAALLISPKWSIRNTDVLAGGAPSLQHLFAGMQHLVEVNAVGWPLSYNATDVSSLLTALQQCESLRTVLLPRDVVFCGTGISGALMMCNVTLPQVLTVSVGGEDVLAALAYRSSHVRALRTHHSACENFALDRACDISTATRPSFESHVLASPSDATWESVLSHTGEVTVADNDSNSDDDADSDFEIPPEDSDYDRVDNIEMSETISRRLSRAAKRFCMRIDKPWIPTYLTVPRIFPNIETLCTRYECIGKHAKTLIGIHDSVDAIQSPHGTVSSLLSLACGHLHNICSMADSLRFLHLERISSIELPPTNQAPNLRVLEQLNLVRCYFDASRAADLFSMCSNLRGLHIVHSPSLLEPDARLMYSLAQMTRINKLVYVENVFLLQKSSKDVILNALRALPRLEHLTMDRHNAATPDHTAIERLEDEFIAAHAPRLRTLCLLDGGTISLVDMPLLDNMMAESFDYAPPRRGDKLVVSQRCLRFVQTSFASLSKLVRDGIRVDRLFPVPCSESRLNNFLKLLRDIDSVIECNVCSVLDLRAVDSHLPWSTNVPLSPAEISNFLCHIIGKAVQHYYEKRSISVDQVRATRSQTHRSTLSRSSYDYALQRIVISPDQASAIRMFANNAYDRFACAAFELYVETAE